MRDSRFIDDRKDEDLPELKLSGEKAVLCTSAYGKIKKELSRMLGVSFTEADNILQNHGVSRMIGKE